jgi:hypothetical protein
MDIAVKIIGIFFIIISIPMLLRPDIFRGLMDFFKKGNRIYFVALLRFALGIVFLLAARECGVIWVIVLFGILFLISGLSIFILGAKRTTAFIEWWQKQSSVIYRLAGVVVLAFGGIIIYSA